MSVTLFYDLRALCLVRSIVHTDVTRLSVNRRDAEGRAKLQTPRLHGLGTVSMERNLFHLLRTVPTTAA